MMIGPKFSLLNVKLLGVQYVVVPSPSYILIPDQDDSRILSSLLRDSLVNLVTIIHLSTK
jgi:hypothetical protein